jgi:hypothetical protein
MTDQHEDQTQVSAEILASDHVSSNGFGAAPPETPAAERPELLLGAAFAGGFLLARIVRRRAS